MNYRQLGATGLKVSVLSFGASSLGSVFHPIDEKEGIRAVHEAFINGINYFDVSPYYGLLKAEHVLGQALLEIPREQIILSTKAGRYGQDHFDFSYERIIRSVEESMKRLNTDYIDILYLHDIEFGHMDQVINEGIPALHDLKRQGKIRFAGVSGLPLQVFRTVLSHEHVDVILSYCHYCLNDDSLLELLPLVQEKGVGLVNASPLSMGLLSGNEPPEWHPAAPVIRNKCLEAYEYCQMKGISLPKLAIQFAVQHEQIPTTLVSTAKPDNIKANIAFALEKPDSAAMQEIRELLSPIQRMSWPSGRPENDKGVFVR
ncbi:aldo/keto reductase [Paenibacillus turpanensis]|uniref:aldo/keto reductase n=1 Tax=Paenibacillus turpanensis TaxID=2689078 RepID=UPI0014095A36|nr:aldo/keto reductase [Paenibacillus turpanensis]